MWKDFKAFINKGNVVMIAVGLVMALYFQQIVNAVLDGVINRATRRSASTSAKRGSRSAS
jgi:large-conductance mechanosensitive channel